MNPDTRPSILIQIEQRQAELNMTDFELSGKLGISNNAYSQDKGKGITKVARLHKIAEILDCSLELKLKANKRGKR